MPKGKSNRRKNVTVFKYVFEKEKNGKKFFEARILEKRHLLLKSHHETLKNAAKAVDIKLIELGKEPVNILKNAKTTIK
jgi:hypothetical protein